MPSNNHDVHNDAKYSTVMVSIFIGVLESVASVEALQRLVQTHLFLARANKGPINFTTRFEKVRGNGADITMVYNVR